MTPSKPRHCACFILAIGHLAQLASSTFGNPDDETIISLPGQNAEATAQVGDEILHQGKYYERDVIHLSVEITIGENGAYTLTPGYYLKTGGGGDWESYLPAANDPEGGTIRKAPDVVTLQEGIQVSTDGKTVGVVTNFYQAVYGEAKGITRSTRPALSTESVQKALVYGGKAGNNIKLGYREIWMHITRPSEIQFVEHDLSESRIVESHGARIEILKATGDAIKYRVLKGFSPTK